MPSAAKAKKAAAKKGSASKAATSKAAAATAPAPVGATPVQADVQVHQAGSVCGWLVKKVQIIAVCIWSGGQTCPDARHASAPTPRLQLVFPASLTARQRAAVHAVGERHGLPHSSQGEGSERRIVLGHAGAPAVVLVEPAGGGAAAGTCSPVSDDQLAALIKQHLQLDAAEEFAQMASSSRSGGGGGGAQRPTVGGGPWRRAEAAAAAKPGSKGLLTPEDFIARVLPLLDMEREAEVAQVLQHRQPLAGLDAPGASTHMRGCLRSTSTACMLRCLARGE